MMGRCITFYGGDSQVGTTMMALAAGEVMARKGKKVLYIDASGNTANVFLQWNPSGNLDDLRPVLQDGIPGPEDLRSVISVCRGMDVIPGLRHSSGMDFDEEDMRRICGAAGGMYEYVLLDGGSGRPEGIRRAALRAADRMVLVITQQEKTLQRLESWMSGRKEGWPENTVLAVNQFTNSGAFYSEEEIRNRLKWENGPVLRLPHVPYGWQAELEGTTLLRFRNYRKAVEKLVQAISEGGGEDGEETDCRADV